MFSIVLLGSCAKEEAPLQSIDPNLVGTWHQNNGEHYWYFYSDGSYYRYQTTAGIGVDSGTYSAENNTLGCQGGAYGVWTYNINGNE